MNAVDNKIHQTEQPARRSWFKRVRTYLYNEWSDIAILPSSRLGRIGLLLLLLLGIWLRVAGLDWGLSYKQPIGPPHHDEPHVMHFLTISWEEYKKQFHEYEIVRPVFLWRVITTPIYALGEYFEWNSSENLVFEYAVPRAVNSVFGVLGLLVIYVLGVRLGGVRSGVLAMALLTVLPGHWYYSQLLKGDLLVTTYNAILLLCAIRIYDRGTRFWYILAGITAGLGAATKPSVVVMLPVVLLAHFLYVWSQRKVKLLVSMNAIMTVGAGILVFFLLYPYPFIDYDRWWTVLTEPTTQFFAINVHPTPQSFLHSWEEYNKPPKVFMEMIFGEALRLAFPITALLFVILTFFAIRAKKGMPFFLTALSAFIIFHSLSFTGALDDRYAMPLLTFVVLFPAVLAGSLSFAKDPLRIAVGTILSVILLVYTAGVTWAMFPSFALGTDIRIAVVNFLEERIKPTDIIGEFEAGGRQSLPFNREKVISTRIRSHEDDPHMFLFSEPTYLVIPVEPENFDHAFRYQLYTPELKQEFPGYLQSFEHVRRFGEEPTVFNRKLPRMLSTPIFDVYKYIGTKFKSTMNLLTGQPWRSLDGSLQDPKAVLSFENPTVLVQETPYAAADLTGKLLTFTFDLSEVNKRRAQEEPVNGTFGPILLFDGQAPKPIPADEADIMVLRDDSWSGVVLPLKHNDVMKENEISVSFYIRPTGRIDVYTTQQGKRIGRMITPPRTFTSVQLGIAVSPKSPLPTTIRLTDVKLETPQQP